MTINELNNQINEGFFSFFNSKNEKKNKIKKTTTKKSSLSDISGGIPIFPECKKGNTVIIGSKYKGEKILNSPYEEDILIKILGNLFVTNWVKTGEKCLKKILSYLLVKYIKEEDIENEENIDLTPIINSLEDNKPTLEIKNVNKYSKQEIKILEKIYERILYHRDSLFNKFFMNPKEFKDGWEEVKTKIIETIENILKTQGNALMHVGMHYSTKYDKKRK